jgi:hypothetical protein
MDQSNILYVGLDVRKDSIDIATADPGRDGEVRRLGSIGGDLTALDQALRKMISRPPELTRRDEARWAQQNRMVGQRPHHPPWRRDDLDCCHQYSFSPSDRPSRPAFQEKLRATHPPESLCPPAGHGSG